MPDETSYLIQSKEFLIILVISLCIFLLYILQIKNQFRIKKWQKSLNLKQHSRIFMRLYQEVNGFILSRKAREQHDAFEYVYGEIEFFSFIALLSLVKPDSKTVFYDLGSGTGKAVLACAMVYPISKSVGVELFPELHQIACKQILYLAAIPEYTDKAKKISFILGDYFKEDLSDATLIFVNSTGLFGESWEMLCSRLNKLPRLNTVITTSKALVKSDYALVSSTKIQMSWGVVHAFIHSRKTNYH